jgi:hypothetical protein
MASSFSLADGGLINFGASNEIKLTHVHNVGLTLTHTATGDNLPVVLQLKSEENEIVANEVIASIEFAAGDSDGTDGATVAAGIHAIAEGTFSATVNETKLVFTTGVSETAASSAAAKMTLSSLGNIDINGSLTNTSGVLSFADNRITTSNDIYAKNIKTSHFHNNTWKQMGHDIDGQAAGDQFGFSVALSANGKIAAIASPVHASSQGEVQIYEFNETTFLWEQKGSDINGESSGDSFGMHSVWLSSDGNIVAVGARKNDAGGGSTDNRGHMRMLEFNGSAWVQLGGDIDGDAAGDYLGISVALSSDGHTVVGGAYLAGAGDKGHVQIHHYDGSSWVQKGSNIEGDEDGDKFGHVVRINADGNIVAIGAPLNDGAADNQANIGQVKVYYWNSSSLTWIQKGSTIYGATAGDNFGHAISLSANGDILAIGSPNSEADGDSPDTDRGHVSVYYWTGSTWTQRGADIDGGATGDAFGVDVSISSNGNVLGIGAQDSDTAGYAAVYYWTGITWNQIGSNILGEAVADLFGAFLQLNADGTTVVIGGVNNDAVGNNAGHARIYKLGDYINGLSTGVVKSIAYTGTPEGGGIDASDAVSISVGEFNSEIVTTLFVDIGAGSILSSGTAGDVIGNDGVANAYITRITKAVNGVVYKGEIICLEVPTTGDPDINVCANSSGTIAEDAAGEGQHVLANCGIHTLALRTEFTIPADGIDDDYIYLTHGGTTAQTYNAGKFLIRFYGAKATGL